MYAFVFSNDRHQKTYTSWNRPTAKQMANHRGQFDRIVLNRALSDYTITGYGVHPVYEALKQYALESHFSGHVLEVPTHGDAVWIKLNHDVMGRNTGLKLIGSYKDIVVDELHEAGKLYQSANADLEKAIKTSGNMNWTLRGAQDLGRKIQGQLEDFSMESLNQCQALVAQMELEYKKKNQQNQILKDALEFQRNKVLTVLKNKSLTSFAR